MDNCPSMYEVVSSVVADLLRTDRQRRDLLAVTAIKIPNTHDADNNSCYLFTVMGRYGPMVMEWYYLQEGIIADHNIYTRAYCIDNLNIDLGTYRGGS